MRTTKTTKTKGSSSPAYSRCITLRHEIRALRGYIGARFEEMIAGTDGSRVPPPVPEPSEMDRARHSVRAKQLGIDISLTAKDVAGALGVSVSRAYELMDEMGAERYGRSKRVSREKFQIWRNSKSVGTSGTSGYLGGGYQRAALTEKLQLQLRAKSSEPQWTRSIKPRTRPRSVQPPENS